MQHASGKDYDPSAWARQRQERIKRALQARQKRQSGSPDKNHTFKPQLLSNTENAPSKLPAGARVGDASAKPGTYDLTVLETMDDAFPPNRSTSNIYRDNRYDQGGVSSGRDKGPMEFGDTGDSLDRLAGGATDRQMLSRTGSTGSHSSAAAAPPPLPSPTNSASHQDGHNRHANSNGQGHRRRHSTLGEGGAEGGGGAHHRRVRQHDPDPGGRWAGPTRERETNGGAYDDGYDYYDHAVKANGVEKIVRGGPGRNRHSPGAAASEDALSHEMEQRPHVRGSINEEHDDGHHRQPYSAGGDDSVDGMGRRGGGMGALSKRAGRQNGGDVRDESDHDLPPEGPRNYDPESTRPEDAGFLESLRGGGGAGAGARRRGENGGSGSCPSSGKQRARARQARRPEWDSDTTAVASLGGAQTTILTDNSPAAVQARLESSSRRKNRDDGIADSPYAAGGSSNIITSKNSQTTNHNNSNGSSNAAWKHKHTKTLPWGEDGVIGVDAGGGGDSGSGGSSTLDADAGRQEEGFGHQSAADRFAAERTEGGRGGRAREGYRLQMVPSPSTGALTVATKAKTVYRGGDKADERQHHSGIAAGGRGIPAEKEQLRRNLSLLKKKMHSQAGSRRSQSAGPRAGDLFGDPNAPSEPGYPEPQHAGARQHLHMTTGTAPAMMSASSGAFLRDRDTTARRGLGKRGAGGARGRPLPEGPGSPYAVDPNSNPLGAAGAARTRPHQHRQSLPQRQYRQQQQHQASTRALDSTGRASNGEDFYNPSHDIEAASGAVSYRRGGGHRSAMGNRGSPRPNAYSGRAAARGSHDAAGGRGDDATARSGGRYRGGCGSGASSGQSSPARRRAWEGANGGGDPRGDSRGKGGNGGGDGGGFAAELPPDAFPDKPVELQECRMCGRRFTSQALERHSRACQKVFQAKRKVFNTAEMRIKGTELEKFAKTKGQRNRGGSGRNGHGGKAQPRGFDDTPVGGARGGKTSKWRQQSKQFRDALRQARVVTDAQKSGKSLANLPPPQPSAPDPSFIPCPHCGRRFSALAGERHIPHCKNIKAKPSALKKGSGSLLGHAARKSSSGASGRGKDQRW